MRLTGPYGTFVDDRPPPRAALRLIVAARSGTDVIDGERFRAWQMSDASRTSAPPIDTLDEQAGA